MALHILFLVLVFTLGTSESRGIINTAAPCSSSPCQNGGICEDSKLSSLGYECSCPSGYRGSNCHIYDPCSMSPCLNGGICKESTFSSLGYVCPCPSGYRGSSCDIYDPCTSSPCQNGGICEDSTLSHLGYLCSCLSGYNGENCDIYDPCLLSPCQNGGTCENSTFVNLGYLCTCPSGYTGSNCDIYDPCWSSPCHNGGTCDSGFSSLEYLCICPSGYSGQNCDFTKDNLDLSPPTSAQSSSTMTVTYIFVPFAVLLKMAVCIGCIYARRRRTLILQPVTTLASIEVSNRTVSPCHVAPPPYRPQADVEGAVGQAAINPGYDVTSAAPQHNVSSGVEPGIVSVNDLDCPPSYEETIKPLQRHNDRQPLI